MTAPGARVLADSISVDGVRLTTFEVTLWRPNLVDFNTHRVFSRNSESSRAIPIGRFIDRVLEDPAGPVEWPTARKGMAGGPPLDGAAADAAGEVWRTMRDAVVAGVHALDKLGVHKSVANRALEPWLWHTVIVTATDYENFFAQRCAVGDDGRPLAQTELYLAAGAMREALARSEPAILEPGEWHTPLVGPDEDLSTADRIRVSAARCAGVSYLNHDGPRNVQRELDRYLRLVTADPPHWSPLEHVATPCQSLDHADHRGNFVGWDQLRHVVADITHELR